MINIEIKLNKEIRKYSESVFMGFSLRQTLFGGLAVAAAAGTYLLLMNKVHGEVVSWLAILAAVPFACIGFIKYHGMPIERLVASFVKYTFFTDKKLIYKPTNLYKENAKLYLNRKREEKYIANHFKKGKTKSGAEHVSADTVSTANDTSEKGI